MLFPSFLLGYNEDVNLIYNGIRSPILFVSSGSPKNSRLLSSITAVLIFSWENLKRENYFESSQGCSDNTPNREGLILVG